MKPKTVAMLYLVGGTLFLIGGLRYALINGDSVGTLISSVNTALFYILAIASYKKKIFK